MTALTAGSENPWTPAAASWALNGLMRDLRVQVKRNGAVVPTFAEPVFRWLAALADAPAPDVSATRPPVGSLDDVGQLMQTVAAAAETAGCSERQVQRLAAAGRIRSRRVGSRVLLIDVPSLLNVRRRTAA